MSQVIHGRQGHLGGANAHGDWQTYTPDVWGWLLLEENIMSVIDIGCGYGHNLKWFLDMGCEGFGVEGDADALASNVVPQENLIRHDYTLGPLVLKRTFDLALSTEFVEHVEQQYEPNWIATAALCRWFLMCHALPGQGGTHHVNEQTSDYWIERLRRERLVYQPYATTIFRNTCIRKPTPWGRPTLMLFRNERL